MSVINQMLRDLDVRAASDHERAGLPSRMRTLPPAKRVATQGWQMLAAGASVGAIVAGLVVALVMQPAAPVPEIAPVSLPAAKALVAEPPVVQTDEGDMKLSALIGQSKQAKPAPRAASVNDVKAPAAEKSAPRQPLLETPVELKVDTQIDKRAKGGALEDAENEYRAGMQAVRRGDQAAAGSLFQRALSLNPEFTRARQAFLSVLVGAKRWTDAQRVAHEGLELDPTQTGWATIMARLQFEQGDSTGAIQTLERFAVHAPHDADYQGLFAYLLQKQQRPAEAAERFRSALQVRPNEGRWWFGLGLSLEQAGNAAGAKEAYAKAKAAGNLPPDMAAAVEQKLK
ncbi:MAG: tetratricopeptide repeat protein [Rhodocyclaceae bacterium]|nr:tetratricopeptide repeat protein [Rhodocyclaceae bacterium]MDZ4215034.1 tetratricopeptide repeat protein [Rhodocyclaceae bacterium]